MLIGRKQLYFLLDCIQDRSEVTPSDEPITISPVANLNKKYSQEDLIGLFTKLEREAKVIEIIQMPKRMDGYLTNGNPNFVIKLLPAFADYYFQIQNEPGYSEFTGKVLPSVEIETSEADEIKRLYKKIADIDEQIRIRREAFTEAQGTINKNPYYSEATRVGHLAKLEQQAQTDIGNFIKQKETYIEELKLRKEFNTKGSKQERTNSVMEEISRLENLSDANFQNVFNILLAIESDLQVEQSRELTIRFASSASELEGYDTTDLSDLHYYYYKAFTYLKNVGCIESYSVDTNALFSDIVINPDKFYEMLQAAKKLYKQKHDKETENLIKNADEIAYKITFTSKREIVLNDNFLLSKLDFDSENEVVFGVLYANPNKKHTVEQLEKATGRKLTKTLHKIVENLGFTGDLKTLFIDTSKNSIRFRNPITTNELNELGITHIKFPR